jgi:predicted aconitase
VNLLKKAGVFLMLSCAPYLVGNTPRKNAIFSWPGSSGIIIANSIFGARGNRDASAAALCSAITGLTPEMLLHKPENRYAELVVYLEDLNLAGLTEVDFGALGYYIGSIAGSKNVALVGNFPSHLPFEKLKYLLSPMPVSGAVSLCHIIGVTPEAPTLEVVLKKGKAKQTTVVGQKELEMGYQLLNTAGTDQVDAVCLGCPHSNISEIKKIAQLIGGKRVREGVRLWVSTADAVYSIAKRMGYVDVIESAKGKVFTDICVMNIPCLQFPHLKLNVKSSATNSARCARYQAQGGIWGGKGLNVFYGSTEQCITAAITGRWGG